MLQTGLAIRRRHCDLMGGVLTAKSIPGRRSAFRVEIPSNLLDAFSDPEG